MVDGWKKTNKQTNSKKQTAIKIEMLLPDHIYETINK
jgi:hypothetical protein